MSQLDTELKQCALCQHMRDKDLKDRVQEAGYHLATHWCKRLDSPTYPTLLRCGGDEFERVKCSPL